MTALAAPVATEPPPRALRDALRDAHRDGELAHTRTPRSAARIKAHGSLESDVRKSVGNALKLGLSLVGTWAVALGIRLILPRYLGPASFGALQFADAFTTTIFIVTTLGVETYVRKEVATRRNHANEFFAGTMLIGLAMGILVMLIALPSLALAGKTETVLRLVLILGLAQIFANVNTILGALLHAVGNVGGLSILNVGAKLAWGVGIALVLSQGLGVQSVAIAMLVTELLRVTGLSLLAKRHAGLRIHVDMKASWRVLAASLPFYIGALAQTAYGRIDISIMSFLTNDVEVGWYAAAAAIGGMSMLLSPLIGWVVLPLTSRAAERSREELMVVGRRAMEVILAAAFPVTLFIWLAAGDIVSIAFGKEFEPATHSLRILAPTFVLTYAAMVTASLLVRLERGWHVTGVSVSGMFVAPALNLWLVPKCYAAFGPGGAGIGAAISLVLTELFTATAMVCTLGRQAFDRRLVVMLAKTIVIFLVVVGVDVLLTHLGLWRLVLDGLLYVALVTLTGAVDVRGGLRYVRETIARRRGASASSAAPASA